MNEPKVVIGVDESGTGAWAGPFYLSAVVAPRGWRHPGVRDSKTTTAAHRLRIVEELEQQCWRDVVHFESAASVDDITAHGHSEAYLRAFEDVVTDAVCALPCSREEALIVVDGVGSVKLFHALTPMQVKFTFMPKADRKVQQVAAASIFAKFNRDVEMKFLDKLHPQYMLSQNAGYGTAEHIAAIKQYGTVPHVHRPITRRG